VREKTRAIIHRREDKGRIENMDKQESKSDVKKEGRLGSYSDADVRLKEEKSRGSSFFSRRITLASRCGTWRHRAHSTASPTFVFASTRRPLAVLPSCLDRRRCPGPIALSLVHSSNPQNNSDEFVAVLIALQNGLFVWRQSTKKNNLANSPQYGFGLSLGRGQCCQIQMSKEIRSAIPSVNRDICRRSLV
jgi:hypothetical protein